MVRNLWEECSGRSRENVSLADAREKQNSVDHQSCAVKNHTSGNARQATNLNWLGPKTWIYIMTKSNWKLWQH